MEKKMSLNSYVELIQEDVNYLKNNLPESLERKHIINVLVASIRLYYPEAIAHKKIKQ